MKGSSVFQTVDDILKFAEITNSHVILVAIDFEKAFDPPNDNCLFKGLEKFNFGLYFILQAAL